MMKNILTLVLALIPSAVFGQAKPADVPDYEPPASITYQTNGSETTIGDGSTARGGVMPVLSKQLPDIPSTATGWVVNSGQTTDCTGAAAECKARFIMEVGHISFDDPIRNYGSPGGSHCHMFFGSTSTNAWSTYASLRNRANQAAAAKRPASTAPGGPYNATGYWFPCIIKTNPFGDGKNYAVRPYQVVIYYLVGNYAQSLKLSRLPRGLRFVFGTNMDDPDDCGVKNEINLANGGPGTGCTMARGSGRFLYAGNGFLSYGQDQVPVGGIKCLTNGSTIVKTTTNKDYSASWVNEDGSDPWGGQCVAGMDLEIGARAPACYDGKNLWAPGGYKHFRYGVNTFQSLPGGGCPNGWFRVPTFQIGLIMRHQGFDDYKLWRLSSDDMAALLSGHPFPGGSSFHTDWMGGWDDTTFYGSADGSIEGWMKACTGVDGGSPHDCNSSTVRVGQHLIGGFVGENAPDESRRPQVAQSPRASTATTSPAGMVEVPTGKGVVPTTINAKPK